MVVVVLKEGKVRRKCKRSLVSSIKVWKKLLEVNRSKLKGLFSLNGDMVSLHVYVCLVLSS